MAIDIRQSLKLSQQLMMTPQLQQAIKLLQLTRVELEQFVTSQLAENPTLEEGTDGEDFDAKKEKTAEDVMAADLSEIHSGLDKIDNTNQKEVDWESMARHKEISSQSNQSTASRKNNSDEAPNYENYIYKETSLVEH